jgi:hypothetical protein
MNQMAQKMLSSCLAFNFFITVHWINEAACNLSSFLKIFDLGNKSSVGDK